MKQLVSDVRRSALVLWVLLKFGAGPLIRHVLQLPPKGLAYPVRIRLALERLGMTYLKLGQFMAMRFDILPMEVCNELRRLFEGVSPLPFDTIRTVLERELNGPLDRYFAAFDVEPTAAASIAQVHQACSRRGDRLAVKVQRPGIETLFETDMRILARIAGLVDWSGWFPGVAARDVVAEFASYTRREMDFILEGRTADRLRSNATPNEKVPRIHWRLTTARVLTMEFIEGCSVARASRLIEAEGIAAVRAQVAGFDPEQALHNFAFASLHQLFGTGFFHADPHPGNILLLDGNDIAFVDFGIFGALTDEKREILARYTENVATGDIEEAYRYYAKLSTPSGMTDLGAFKRDTKAVLRKWYQSSVRLDSPLRDRHVGNVIGEIMAVVRRHSIRVDVDTLLFWRAAIALDSSALSLSDRFDLIKEMRLYFRQQRPSVGERVLDAVLDLDRAAAVKDGLMLAPGHYRRTIGELASGRRRLDVSVEDSAARRRRKNRDARTVSLTLLAASALPLTLLLDDARIRTLGIVALLSVQAVSLLVLERSRR